MSHPIPILSYMNSKGQLVPDYKSTLSVEQLLKCYRTMLLTRHVDERMITLQRQGIITFALSSLGEEACAVGSAAALELADWMYPQYREAGIMFWRGFRVQQYVDHMFGNAGDLTFGRQMPNHFGSRELNIVTVSSPIGTKLPHAAGCAYAMKLQKEQSVAICYFGDGATSEGDFHAGLNFAAVRKVPAIFFCRNNGYAISTPCNRQFASETIAQKGEGYGIQSFRIDGNDIFAVHDTVKNARKICLEGNGPILIEAMTYRMGAHSTSDDPSLYRSEEESKKWTEQCPICRLRSYLEGIGNWDQNQEERLQKEIEDEVTAAIAQAKTKERPQLKYLIEHVYYEPTALLKEEYADLQRFFPNE